MQVLPSLAPSSLLNLSASSSSASTSSATAAAAARTLPPQLNTFTQHLRSVSTTEGIKTLWRGVASVILGAGPAHAAHFGMYEFVREISGGREDGWWGVGGTGE
jgi:solute carrier family 25 iron transporter 28/37